MREVFSEKTAREVEYKKEKIQMITPIPNIQMQGTSIMSKFFLASSSGVKPSSYMFPKAFIESPKTIKVAGIPTPAVKAKNHPRYSKIFSEQVFRLISLPKETDV